MDFEQEFEVIPVTRVKIADTEAYSCLLYTSNYTPSQLREVQDRYAEDQEEWEDAEGGSLNLYLSLIHI